MGYSLKEAQRFLPDLPRLKDLQCIPLVDILHTSFVSDVALRAKKKGCGLFFSLPGSATPLYFGKRPLDKKRGGTPLSTWGCSPSYYISSNTNLRYCQGGSGRILWLLLLLPPPSKLLSPFTIISARSRSDSILFCRWLPRRYAQAPAPARSGCPEG